MGYQVYWANNRFQGYEVTAYCDYPGCTIEIDRGIAYSNYDGTPPKVFCCTKHRDEPFNYLEMVIENKEHPDWLHHVLTDETWENWRKENPKLVEKYKGIQRRMV